MSTWPIGRGCGCSCPCLPTGVPVQGICGAHLVPLHCLMQWDRPAHPDLVSGASGFVVGLLGDLRSHLEEELDRVDRLLDVVGCRPVLLADLFWFGLPRYGMGSYS